MCLANVYLSDSFDRPVLEDIAYVRLLDDHVHLKTLLGEEKTISGKVVEIDFSNSRILISQSNEAG
jgi:predicted RNA-binding protein